MLQNNININVSIFLYKLDNFLKKFDISPNEIYIYFKTEGVDRARSECPNIRAQPFFDIF